MSCCRALRHLVSTQLLNFLFYKRIEDFQELSSLSHFLPYLHYSFRPATLNRQHASPQAALSSHLYSFATREKIQFEIAVKGCWWAWITHTPIAGPVKGEIPHLELCPPCGLAVIKTCVYVIIKSRKDIPSHHVFWVGYVVQG